jgi:hypothetical protein
MQRQRKIPHNLMAGFAAGRRGDAINPAFRQEARGGLEHQENQAEARPAAVDGNPT